MIDDQQPGGGVVACVDVGSNATRLRIFELGAEQRVREVYRKRYPVQLGAGTFTGGRLGEAEISALELALRDAAEIAKQFNAVEILAVATSAVRDASNGHDFIDRVLQSTGVCVRIIDGAEEARLMAAGAVGGVADVAERSDAAAFVIDIGGGSTEIVRLDPGGEVRSFVSIELGAVRLVRQWNLPGTCSVAQALEFVEQAKKFASARLPQEMLSPMDSTRADSGDQEANAWALGGTPGALMRIRSVMSNATKGRSGDVASRVDDQKSVSRQELINMLELIAGAGSDSLVRDYGLDHNRAGLIMAGATILTALTELLSVGRIYPTDRGVCEGLALEYLRT